MFWLNGPGLLKSSEPETVFLPEHFTDDEVIKELKKNTTSLLAPTTSEVICLSDIVNFDRFSSWRKLVRVIAWIKRFIHNIKQTVSEQIFSSGVF